ncbi:hypothetical protein ACTJJ7_15395 [Phyllobacterium sp. 22229]|uniref:hypothetical protein n=1 Tax=Phyllobacterium sp. 22229 TaxID=3453895 RepID=UPI003F87C623
MSDVTVKKLEWEEKDIPYPGSKYWRAQTPFDWGYRVITVAGGFIVHGIGEIQPTLEAAQAEAQADYEARIRSARAPCKQEPVGWQWESAYGDEPLTGRWMVSNTKPHRPSDATDYVMRPLFTHPTTIREDIIRECAEVVQAANLSHGNEREEAVAAILSLLEER